MAQALCRCISISNSGMNHRMKSYTLIHAALLAEGQPIIRYFGLKQCETRPFKLFRAAQLLLIVSGVGKESTRKALEWVTHRFPLSSAINIGIAGCSDMGIEIGTLFAARGGPEAVPRLPLKTVDNPLRTAAEAGRELQEPFLADMEASYFVKSLSKVLDTKNIHILKVVSDHLSDTIPKRAFVSRLIGETLPRWAHLADPYLVKLNQAFDRPPAHALSPEDCTAIRTAALNFRFSFQEIKILMEMALDFRSWDEKPIVYRLRRKFRSREDAFSGIRREWENAKNTVKTYNGFTGRSSREGAGVKEIVDIDRPSPGFGRCPVASPKTRCCNLLTLDAVEGCGFDCSYCSNPPFLR